MKSLILGIATAAILTGGPCFAQATHNETTQNETTQNETTQNDRAAASGDNNQAVATTAANAPGPAKGANSFTMNEAKSRLEKYGFSNVGDLRKDDNGVWRGKAEKNGTTDNVWLDYKGNVGTAHNSTAQQ